jgi:hypothetical protein
VEEQTPRRIGDETQLIGARRPIQIVLRYKNSLVEEIADARSIAGQRIVQRGIRLDKIEAGSVPIEERLLDHRLQNLF